VWRARAPLTDVPLIWPSCRPFDIWVLVDKLQQDKTPIDITADPGPKDTPIQRPRRRRRLGPVLFLLAVTRRALVVAVIGGVAIGLGRTDGGRAAVDAIETRLKNGLSRLPISRPLLRLGQTPSMDAASGRALAQSQR